MTARSVWEMAGSFQTRRVLEFRERERERERCRERERPRQKKKKG
jgi:hypothetical protein